MPRYSSNGASIYYAVDGEGSPVVMLPCLPLDHRVWIHQVFELSTGYKTVAMDFRGLGHSDGITGKCTIESLSEDVNNLLDHEGIEKAIIMGISIGSSVAQRFTVDHPERVRALIVSGFGSTAQNERQQKLFGERIIGYASPEAESYYEKHLRGIFSPDFAISSVGESIISNYLSLSRVKDFKSISKLFEAIKEFDLQNEVKEMRVPTAIIEGEKDNVFDGAKALAEEIPNSKFFIVPGSGHAVCIENPIAYNSYLLPFLRTLHD